MSDNRDQRRRCYVRENNGQVTRRPCVVARGMIARHEAEEYVTGVTHAEAMAILKNGQKMNDVLRARAERAQKEQQGKR